jgi:hypothetical protein
LLNSSCQECSYEISGDNAALYIIIFFLIENFTMAIASTFRTRQVRAATTVARAVTTVTKVKIRWDKAIYDLTIYDLRLKFVLLNNRAYAGIYDTKSNRTS